VFKTVAETRMPRNILLMTATIRPLPGIPALARTDPKVRLQDYQRSLVFYSGHLGSCFDAIVFAENSASDLSPLAAATANCRHFDKIEFIPFSGLDYKPSYGRGYGEFQLIDHAIKTSKLLLPDDVIWKVTGRYIVKNIERIVASRPQTADLYCHMRNYPYRLCELYLLSWSRRGYEVLIKNIYSKLRNDVNPNEHTIEETLFRELADQSREKINIVPRFKIVPILEGFRGFDNRQYRNAWSIKTAARRLARIFLPSLWI
jgi:hypothetical protein